MMNDIIRRIPVTPSTMATMAEIDILEDGGSVLVKVTSGGKVVVILDTDGGDGRGGGEICVSGSNFFPLRAFK